MMRHGLYMWICAGLVAIAAIAWTTTGSAVAMMPVLGCVVMMGVMMAMMGGHGRSGGK